MRRTAGVPWRTALGRGGQTRGSAARAGHRHRRPPRGYPGCCLGGRGGRFRHLVVRGACGAGGPAQSRYPYSADGRGRRDGVRRGGNATSPSGRRRHLGGGAGSLSSRHRLIQRITPRTSAGVAPVVASQSWQHPTESPGRPRCAFNLGLWRRSATRMWRPDPACGSA